MPGTITLMNGKRILEVRNYDNGKQIRKIFEELDQIIKENHQNKALYYVINTIYEEKLGNYLT